MDLLRKRSAESVFYLIRQGEVTADVHSLVQDAMSPGQDAVPAIRLLGMLAEEGLVPLEEALPPLRGLLFHEDPHHVYYAVKALWQARDLESIPLIRDLSKRGVSEDVTRIARRALRSETFRVP